MRVINPGHTYELACRDGGIQILQFYQDAAIHGEDQYCDGVLCQEVLRALIDRIKTLEKEKPAIENSGILYHARAMLALFEARALRVSAEKGEPLEDVPTGPKGHFHK